MGATVAKVIGSLIGRTLAIIKPDAVAKGRRPDLRPHREGGLHRPAVRMIQMTAEDAAGSLRGAPRAAVPSRACARSVTLGPCLPMVLEADNAIQRWRDLMGATDPAKAAAGTIRKDSRAASIEGQRRPRLRRPRRPPPSRSRTSSAASDLCPR